MDKKGGSEAAAAMDETKWLLSHMHKTPLNYLQKVQVVLAEGLPTLCCCVPLRTGTLLLSLALLGCALADIKLGFAAAVAALKSVAVPEAVFAAASVFLGATSLFCGMLLFLGTFTYTPILLAYLPMITPVLAFVSGFSGSAALAYIAYLYFHPDSPEMMGISWMASFYGQALLLWYTGKASEFTYQKMGGGSNVAEVTSKYPLGQLREEPGQAPTPAHTLPVAPKPEPPKWWKAAGPVSGPVSAV